MNKNIREIITYVHCPISKGNLVRIEVGLIDKLNKKIARGKLFFVNGALVQDSITEGLTTVDGKYIYLIKEGIIVLLPNLAIMAKGNKSKLKINVKESRVQAFYEKIGWKKLGDKFEDAVQFEDLRPVVQEYIHNCHKRLNDYIPKSGKFIVDIASGPIQYKEYLHYSYNFDYRVCIDFSLRALREAKKKLGSKGIYILGDITNIPLKSSSMDCVISLHTIYHVTSALQTQAFLEIHRILKPSASAVIVYTWLRSPLVAWMMSPVNLVGGLKKLVYHTPKVKSGKLYFHPKSYQWFTSYRWRFRYQIYCWRSIDINVSKLYIKEWLLGKLVLKLLFSLENRFSQLFGRIGQYPIIIIQKNE